MNLKALYSDRIFSSPGPKNTDNVLRQVNARAGELGVKHVLVASTTGRTAMNARKTLDQALEVICVTHATGYAKPNLQELSEEARHELEALGVRVLTCQHAFGGVGRAVRHKLSTYQIDEIIAYTLRIFGQGTKVAVELVLMAADAGLIRTDENVISLGGTGKGADTALAIRPANSANFFDLKVIDVICKPAMVD